MPLYPDLNAFIQARLGTSALPSGGAGRSSQLVAPPAVVDLPQPTQEEFYRGELRKREAGPSGPFGLGTFHRLLEILSSGEYAVSNFLSNTIKALQGESDWSPLAAAWKGFESAFRDDQPQYKKRIFDVLTELGWKPDEEWDTEDVFKRAVGFIGGVLLDPVTYIWPGGAIGKRIGRETVKSVATESGLALPRRFLRGMVVNRKLGKKVLSGITKDEYKTAGVRGLERFVKSSFEGERRMTRLLWPTEGMTLPAALRAKGGRENVVAALRHMGKEASTENIAWFVKTGYKQLADPGGLRVFGGRLFAPRGSYFNPETANEVGFNLGQAMKHGTPLHHGLAAKVVESDVWDDVVRKPLEALFKPFRERLSKFRGADAHTKMLIKALAGAPKVGEEQARVLTNSLVGDLTARESRVVGRLLIKARAENKLTENLEEWAYRQLVTAPDDKVQGWYRELGMKVSDAQGKKMTDAAMRVRNALIERGQWEQEVGLLDRFLPDYVTRIYRKPHRSWLKDPEKVRGASRFWNLQQTVGEDFDAVRAAVRAGDFSKYPGMLEDDIRKILMARLGTSFASQHARGVFGMMLKYGAAFPHTKGAINSLLKNPKWVAKHPQLAEAISMFARHPYDKADNLAGLPLNTANFISKEFHLLQYKSATEAAARKRIERIIKKMGDTRSLTEGNVEGIMKQFDAVKTHRAMLASDPEQDAIVQVIDASGPALRATLEANLAHRTSDRMIRQLEKEFWSRPPLGEGLSDAAQKTLEDVRHAKKASFHGLSQGQVDVAAKGILHDTVTAWEVKTGQKVHPGRLAEYDQKFANYSGVIGNHSRRAKEWENAYKTAKRYGPDHPDFNRSIAIGKDEAERVIRDSEAIQKRIHTISSRPGFREDPVAQAEAEVLQRSLLTLQEIRQDLPTKRFAKSLTEARGEISAAQAASVEIQRMAKEAGTEKYLSSITRYVSPTKHLEDMEPSKIKALRKILTPAQAPDSVAARYLTVREDLSQVKAALEGKRIHFQSPVTGRKFPAPRLLAGTDAFAGAVDEAMKHKELGWFLEKVDWATSWFRRLVTAQFGPLIPIMRPAFHVRNAVDLSFRTGVGYGLRSLVDARAWQDAYRVLKGSSGKIGSKYYQFSYDEVRDLLARCDLLDVGRARRWDLGEGGGLSKAVERMSEKYWPEQLDTIQKATDFLERHPLIQRVGPRRLGSDMESLAAAHGLISALKQGASAQEAVEQLGQFLFYYGNLTQFERSVMKNLVPFWTFQRQAIDFVSWAALKRPRLFNYFPRIADFSSLSPEEEALLPEWVADYPFVSFERKGNALRVLSMRNVFTVDVLPEVLPTQWRDLVGQLNPLFMTPAELYFEKDVYFNRKIKPVKYLYNQLRTKPMQEIFSFLHPREVTLANGNKYIAVDGPAYHLLRRTWFSRFYRDLDAIFDTLGGFGAENLSGFLSGFKLLELDLERQAGYAQVDASRARNEYRRALKAGDRRRAIEVLEEQRMR